MNRSVFSSKRTHSRHRGVKSDQYVPNIIINHEAPLLHKTESQHKTNEDISMVLRHLRSLSPTQERSRAPAIRKRSINHSALVEKPHLVPISQIDPEILKNYYEHCLMVKKYKRLVRDTKNARFAGLRSPLCFRRKIKLYRGTASRPFSEERALNNPEKSSPM